MPVITITLAEGQTQAEQKATLIREYTRSSVEVMGLPEQAFTVLFHELPVENIGLGGKALPEILEEKNKQ